MNWSELLSEAIKALVVALTPILLTLGFKLFNSVRAWIEAKTTNEAILRIEKEVFDVVSFVAQSIRPALEECAKDGILTAAEKQRMKDIAVEAVKLRLQGLPAQMLPGLEKRIGESVESAVGKLKIFSNPPQPQESK